MPYTAVEYAVRDKVATTTLNRPAARNGYTVTMAGAAGSWRPRPGRRR